MLGKRVVGAALALAVTLLALGPSAHADDSVTAVYYNGIDLPGGPLVVFVGNKSVPSGAMWFTARASTVSITVDDVDMKLGRTVALSVYRGNETLWAGCVGAGQAVTLRNLALGTGLFVRVGQSLVAGRALCSSRGTAGVMKVTNVSPW